MLSHALDMMSFADGAAHDLHGRQVGVGTILASELYRRLLEIRHPGFRDPPGVDRDFWGPLADPVADEFARKLDRYRQAAERLSGPGAWDDLRNALTPMLRPPEVIRDCLERAGAAFKAEHIGCDRKRLLDAFRHAHQIRSRFTVLDLAWLVGLMPGAADAIVAQWA
jgi:glycerol-1-phosphate dehydrogenase [NAD(P)+]